MDVRDPSNEHYFCFGACGAHGDAITFVMERENCTFAEACEQLEPVTTGQCEIEQDQIGIRFARQRCVRIGCVLRLHQLERRIEHGEHMLQCFLDQRMIVDDEYLHRSSPKAWDEDAPRSGVQADCMLTYSPVNCRKLQVSSLQRLPAWQAAGKMAQNHRVDLRI